MARKAGSSGDAHPLACAFTRARWRTLAANGPAPHARKAAGSACAFTWVEESTIQSLMPEPGFLKAVVVEGERRMRLDKKL